MSEAYVTVHHVQPEQHSGTYGSLCFVAHKDYLASLRS